MDNFKGAVAVITGAAGGIGFALAKAAQARGAKLVLSDLRADALQAAKTKLEDGGDVLAVVCDVAQPASVEALAQAAIDRFGKVNLLFNNAGVFASGVSWEISSAEYDWVIDVNQKSVINGIRAFVPRMIAQKDPCHVMTIASGAGITVNPGFATYSMTKHAVVALTEALYLDLAAQRIANIGVTLAMPGMTQSGIMQPEKTGPSKLQAELAARQNNPVLGSIEALMRAGVDGGLPAADLAESVFDAIARNELYVLPAFSDDANRALATSIGVGRATGKNLYPPILETLLSALQQTHA